MTTYGKDIWSFLFLQFIEPHVVFLYLVFNDSHGQRPDLEVQNDSVELWKAGETEERVDDVGGQFCAAFPVLTQYPCQCTHDRLWKKTIGYF